MIVDVDGINYHIETKGKKGPALLLLHGFTGDLSQWERYVDKWKESYYVIMVDIIGHGQTDSPSNIDSYRMDRVADQIICLINKLGVEHINILGYSMGGRLALTIAHRAPTLVHALLLVGASPGLKTIDERQERIQKDEELAAFILKEGILAFVDYWERIPLFASQKSLPKDVRNKLRQQRLQNNPVGLANSLRGMGTGRQHPLWDELSKLDNPTFLVVGELDTKFINIARAMNESINTCHLILINNAGHAVHVEEPEKFDKIVVDQFYKYVSKGLDNNGN